MKEWKILFEKESKKDALKLQSAGLKEKTKYLLEILKKDPFVNPPGYEKLTRIPEPVRSVCGNLFHQQAINSV